MATVEFTYNDIANVRWVVLATIYERSDDNVIAERGEYEVGTYASYNLARLVQVQRSEHAALKDAYGTWGMEHLIVTFRILPYRNGAYAGLTSYSVDN